MERNPYLESMGIVQWARRERVGPAAPVAQDKPDSVAETAPADSGHAEQRPAADSAATGKGVTPDASGLDWQQLQTAVAQCTACALHASRTNTVFGVGDPQARFMVIGEAPGAEEDRQGEPFVGRAGKLLDAMLLAIGFKREQVFIANILKCRPPNNRDPRPEEVLQCQPYLRRQIELIQPAVILAVGRVAAQNLLGIDSPMKDMRGQDYTYADTGIPVVVTYHPAYLLRSPLEKRKAWQDLQRAQRIYREAME
ncbi:MAG: uracil-DNA glycosylase [Granulosicoccaceae bacterium]|jgi:DNA polymerase